MLTANPIIAFIATAKPDEATMFYRDRLGLRLAADTEFALEFEIEETMLRVQKVEAVAPASHTVLGWKVGNIAEEVEALTKRGINFERYEGMAQDESGIWQSPSGARVAWFRDPDGNILSLTQFPPATAPAANGS
jgi:catechol 2,3-dioxygenase-like lactoylglutathione lyase family enzyme